MTTPNLYLDGKKIELLTLATSAKGSKITPTILSKLKESPVENVLMQITSRSRTATATPEPTQRRGVKRRGADDSSKPHAAQKENKCAKCGCRLLRAVDNGRPDKRLVLECMRRDCLATLNFTEIPVGTVIGAESFSPNSYYRDPSRMYYPSAQQIERSIQESKNPKETVFDNLIENDRGSLLIAVPGQTTKARLM